MPFVSFKTIPPYNEVVVNTDEIIAITPEPSTPENDTELLADAVRQILVLEPIDAVGAKLGADFRKMSAASTAFDTTYINKRLVLHILPHPQVPGVCLVHGRSRRIAVKGSVAEVVKALS